MGVIISLSVPFARFASANAAITAQTTYSMGKDKNMNFIKHFLFWNTFHIS